MDHFASATELAALIRRREVSPVEVGQYYLSRIDAYDGEINAFVWRDDAAFLAQARAVEKAIGAGENLGPFAGVPMPIKDLVNVAGQPNTRGSLGISDAPQPASDPIVDRIKGGGFLLMGRTNTAEAGMTQVTENRRYGITRTPWNLTRTPGGSSGGAAAAVAAGLAPVANASDGGGSIRMPASCTGLVGLKPSRARVPTKVLGWEHGSTGGVVTRTVEDTARILDLISVPDPLGWYRAPAPERPFADEVGRAPGRLKIGLLLEAPTGVSVDPQCAEAALRTARLLEAEGHAVVPVKPDIISRRALDIYLFTVIAAALHTVPFDDLTVVEPFIVARRRMGEQVHSGAYAKAVVEMHLECRKMIEHWTTDFDVLLTPTLATRVPEVGVIMADANRVLDGSSEHEARMLAFNVFANITGLPAISLPVGFDSDGLPVGAQLVGGPFQEGTLIRLASSLENHLQWQSRRPARYA
jgi:amidase